MAVKDSFVKTHNEYCKPLDIYNVGFVAGVTGGESHTVRTGLIMGGQIFGAHDKIDQFAMATPGNATDFGNLTSSRFDCTSFASETRGVSMAGTLANYTRVDTMDYVTIANAGNASDFGDLTRTKGNVTGLSNGTRGVCAGGFSDDGVSGDARVLKELDYVTIASTGNVSDFGDLTTGTMHCAGADNATRGLISYGGIIGSNQQVTVEYITVASTGNATDFGDLTSARSKHAGVFSDTRVVWGGGSSASVSHQDIMEYMTVATTGNATDFGDLVRGKSNHASCSSLTRGVFAGGRDSDNQMDAITIATLGNATDFGDLNFGRTLMGGCSGN